MADKDKEITKLKEKLKDKDKVVEAEIEKYITTHSDVVEEKKEEPSDEE